MSALFALAIAVFGALSAVFAQAGEATYADLNRGRAPVAFVRGGGATEVADDAALVRFHSDTLAYVRGRSDALPRAADGEPLFDGSERAHLADVRGVFAGADAAWIASGVLAAVLLLLGARRGYPVELLRRGTAYALAGTVALAAVAALAFGPAFLAFHYLFFPQGNFLFDPATSNLLRLYPESYWYGVTLRVALTLAASLLALFFLATLASRRGGSR